VGRPGQVAEGRQCGERGRLGGPPARGRARWVGEGDTTEEAVRFLRDARVGVQGVWGVTPGTPTRPEESGALRRGICAATRCGRVSVGAVEGACAVWVGVEEVAVQELRSNVSANGWLSLVVSPRMMAGR
jgi:hypothetical protein